MEAFGRLQHVQILVELIVFTDKLITEHTKTLLAQHLHLLINSSCSLLFMLAQQCVHVVRLDMAASIAALTNISNRPLFEHLLEW